MLKIVIGGAIGALAGGLVGYVGKCMGGGCPLTCNPVGGILVGTLMGVLIASSVGLPAAAYSPSRHLIHVADDAELAEILRTNEVVLVDFFADWCGPCRRLKPTIHQIADEYAGRVAVLGVDVERAQDLAQKYGVSTIPDVRIFRGGEVAQRLQGVQRKQTYTDVIDGLLGPAG